MPKVKPPTRQEQAAATRRRMLDAAYDLFCTQGLRTTTMADIAARADVAVQTLYFTFHTRDELLSAVLARTVEGDDLVPPPLQPWHRAAVAEPDVGRAVRGFVTGCAGIVARVAPMLPAFHAVAFEPVGEIWRRSEALRHEGFTEIVDVLVRKAPLRRGLTKARATDILFVLVGPDSYRTFVLERGWTPRAWITWATGAVLVELFDRR